MIPLARQIISKSKFCCVRFSSNEADRIEESFKQRSSSSTVDRKDVHNLSQYSENWWDPNGEMGPLHSFNPLRIQLIRDGLLNVGHQEKNPCKPLEGVSVLDVGCGGGILSEPLTRIGANVIGIDASKELISIAKEHQTYDRNISSNLTYIQTTVEDHAEENKNKYDVVVASEILEHVLDHELFLSSCSKVLKPKGSLFITTLNKTMFSWIGGIVAAEYVLRLLPMGTHDWNKFISPEDTRRILEKFDCRTKLIHGIFYNPVTNTWSWTSSTAINYAIHAVKLTPKLE